MNTTNGYLLGIWAVVGLLIAVAIFLLTTGNVVLAWGGVILMLAAVGGAANWFWLAWRSTKAQLTTESDE
jgi:hypothetical protein